jgi:hypothetical protein
MCSELERTDGLDADASPSASISCESPVARRNQRNIVPNPGKASSFKVSLAALCGETLLRRRTSRGKLVDLPAGPPSGLKRRSTLGASNVAVNGPDETF